MSISRPNFEDLQECDLRELKENQITESMFIEYKKEIYGNSDAERREALKDISAFANTNGGHLILGIEETGGIPTEICGVYNADPNSVVERLGQMARTGIEPRIQGLQIRAISLSNGRHCVVFRIPSGWNPPYRVSFQGWNKFWIRNSSGTHEASMEELRSLFNRGTDALQKAHQFRVERIKHIRQGDYPRPLQAGGRMILHLVPLASLLSRYSVDLQRIAANHSLFNPIGASGVTSRFVLDGYANERGGEKNFGYTKIFRNGILEATKANMNNSNSAQMQVISAKNLEELLIGTLPNYLNGLQKSGVPAPIVVMLTLEGVSGTTYLVTSGEWPDEATPLHDDIVLLPEGIVNDYGANRDYFQAIRPAIDALWNSCGRAFAASFSSDGKWRGTE